MDGAGMIVTERIRQITEERWDWSHDDEHTDGQLAEAAVCYATPPRSGCRRSTETVNGVPRVWPWEDDWWKPTPDNRIRELVKAGALIAAEIDRLQRLIENRLADEESDMPRSDCPNCGGVPDPTGAKCQVCQ